MKRIAIAALVLVMAIAPLYLRLFLEGRENLASAHAACQSGNTLECVERYRETIGWRAPGLPYASIAAQELRALAASAATAPDLKMRALEALKSGYRMSRSFLHPERYDDPSSNASEARTALRAEAKLPEVPPIIDMSAKDVAYGWQALAQVCFWTWIGAVAFLIFRTFDKDGRFLVGKALHPATVVSVIAYGAWMYSLSNG